ncbi:hypothetical protein CFR78_15235 [Komagataeibacter rhaeticus]|uniref:Uncharacterized protein n=1 Tax=Komagataeibacter rhaeticus TaxID=215221 RepID=A0A181C7L7_9PROT|nr:hypothetical protein [Komagataeibacter rhaeticus]ATU73664.1 hypothetical protein CT154_13395 [Komagataeibacter xylinus]EGG76380.1 hypothetical protein SXCC_03004 [Gluconacetobacter sp. SXCC-1]MBL7240771.1 hypothetical protein [Komagataeibacter rhaeticus]MDT8870868.1 hypothetical protein [Komagataeibacter rhaeticus]PYD52351.1 hypothetical protein CFR78_15235 [Komagataeibacter rhaeticus]
MTEERDATGRAVVYPTVSCGAEAVQDSIVVMDLFMATAPEHMPKGDRRVVTVLPPELALNLARQLTAAAGKVQAARAAKAAPASPDSRRPA